MVTDISPADALIIAEWDWLYAPPRYKILHHFPLTPEQAAELWYDMPTVTSTCGKVTQAPRIPGWFSRMSLKRCSRCCDLLGYPRGKQSPKNDDACRPLVKARLKTLGLEP